MTHEEKACEIVNNFKGATVDHFGCCLMQEQIVKALASAEKNGYKSGLEQGLFDAKMEYQRGWNEAIAEAVNVAREYKIKRLDGEKILTLGGFEIASKIEALRKG